MATRRKKAAPRAPAQESDPQAILRDVLFVPLDELHHDPENAKDHAAEDVSAVAESLQSFGQHRVAVAVRQEGRLVVKIGNGMLAAARRLGWEKLAVVVAPDDMDTARARALADNRTAELSAWNTEVLARQLQELPPPLLGATGFSEDDVADLLADIGPPAVPGVDELEQPTAEDEAPFVEPPPKPLTREGDLWELGPHRLLCGDSTSDDDIARLVGDREVRCVVTDPPFAIYGSSTGIGSDIADDKMVRPFFEALFQRIERLLRDFDHAYVCCDWRSWAAMWNASARSTMRVRNMVVWDKGGSGLGNNYANTHELVAFLVRMPPAKAMKSSEKRGHRPVLRPNIVRVPRVTGAERAHNAAKPVALLQEVIQNSTKEGWWVLDLFGGSGQTMIAAGQLGRPCLTMEIEPRWCDVIVSRWQAKTGEVARRVDAKGKEQPGIK